MENCRGGPRGMRKNRWKKTCSQKQLIRRDTVRKNEGILLSDQARIFPFNGALRLNVNSLWVAFTNTFNESPYWFVDIRDGRVRERER